MNTEETLESTNLQTVKTVTVRKPDQHTSGKTITDPQSEVGSDTLLKKQAKTPLDPHSLRNRRITAFVVLITGICLLLYPVVATVINNQEHQKIVHDTLKKAQNLDPLVLKSKLAEAEKYNKTLSYGPIFDPFLQKVVPNSPQYRDYRKILDFSGVMGSIHIPKIKVQLPIYHGTDDATLARGVGHLFGSSLPVGGQSSKAVLTAHSGLGNATMFDDLPQLKPGDPIFLQVGGKTFKYKVIGSKVVLPDNTSDLQVENGRDLIVLVTCTPYAVNTHRLLVTAERVAYNPSHDKNALDVKESPWRIWMGFSLFIVVVAVGFYLWLLVRNYKKKRAGSDPTQKDLNSGLPVTEALKEAVVFPEKPENQVGSLDSSGSENYLSTPTRPLEGEIENK